TGSCFSSEPESPGLKPIEAQNARSSSACVPYPASMCQQWLVENSVWKRQTCSVVINDALAIGATRWAGWRRTPQCLYVLSTKANDLGTRDCSSARRNLSSRSTFGPFEFA